MNNNEWLLCDRSDKMLSALKAGGGYEDELAIFAKRVLPGVAFHPGCLDMPDIDWAILCASTAATSKTNVSNTAYVEALSTQANLLRQLIQSPFKD
jgi:hypothetical protein